MYTVILYISVPLSSIYENVIKNGEGRNMTEAHVRAALDQIGCHCSRIGTEESYSLDLKNIVEIAQNDEVESLVSKRYGRAAYSLFRLLSKTGKLMGTDKIADTLIMENMEALKILYSLWKDDYVHMEKLVSHGSAQSQYLLWRVNKCTVREHVFDETCHAALNLRLKLAYELEQEREIIQLPKDKRIGAQGKRFEHSRQVNILLESSLMKLDEALMLFYDFCNT
ncbi:hypothetical protein IFM89_031335 [Coptis chinensis]|uniref:DNA-directed RNA polymerase III subunit RPC3 n=1 Tax=Coptis chinensis TaxID=261450 RepID=A0A835IZ99_9MAGN|nr:hypothetical protein IFM89_031335 [Coptis chinensis]